MSVYAVIEKKINASFDVSDFKLINESHMHNVSADSETHFKLLLVSDDFVALKKVARHQKIYQVLANELGSGVHALAIHAYTKAEWQQRNAMPDSPPCHGGSNK